MFGYVVADQNSMTGGQLERYKGWYCGLCRALKAQSGTLSRMTLNYDMTFLIMLLSSLYEPETSSGRGRCAMHPVREHVFLQNKYTAYVADMNLALALHSLLDGYRDDGSLVKLGFAKMLKSRYNDVSERYPRQCGTMEQKLAELSDVESSGEYAPDAAANIFGDIMGEVFVPDPGDFWADSLRRTGQALGRFVYMLDACADLNADIKSSRYNPLLRADGSHMDCDEAGRMLTMLIGDCALEFERLPLVQDVDIMHNVIYSGVWQRYHPAQTKTKRTGTDVNDDS